MNLKKSKTYKHKRFYVQNKYIHRIEALKRFPGNTFVGSFAESDIYFCYHCY